MPWGLLFTRLPRWKVRGLIDSANWQALVTADSTALTTCSSTAAVAALRALALAFRYHLQSCAVPAGIQELVQHVPPGKDLVRCPWPLFATGC